MFDKKLAIKCLDLSVLAYKGMGKWRDFSGEEASEKRVEWMYGDAEEERIDSEYSNRLQLFENKETDTQGIFYESDALYIAFRGSESNTDWKGNLNYKQMEAPFNRDPSVKADRVHSGFLKDYMSVRDSVLEKVKKWTGKKIIVTGHSLGAALSSICALDVQYNFPEMEVILYNFGAPRVGNKEYINAHRKRVAEAYQVRNGNDAVTHVPFKAMGFVDTRKYLQVNLWKPWLSALDHFPSGYLKGLRKL